MILEIIIFLILSNILFGIYLYWRIKEFYKLPNNFGIPVIGNLYCYYKGLFSSTMHESYKFMDKILDKYGNGDICFTLMHGQITVLLACPLLLEEIAYHPNLEDKPPVAYGAVNGFVKGIFSFCHFNKELKQRKKEMNKCLTKKRIEGPYSEVFISVGKYLTENMSKKAKNIDIYYESVFAASSSVKGTFYGIKELIKPDRGIFKTFKMLMHNASRGVANPLYGRIFFQIVSIFENIFIPSIEKFKSQIVGDVRTMIKNVENEEDHSKIPLSTVISLRHKNCKKSIREMKKELYELVVAGSHTVSVVLSAAISFLAMFPDIQEKAWKEQYEIFGNDPREPTQKDIYKMSYLERFMNESIRIVGPPFIGKWSTGKFNIGDATVPAGSIVVILQYKMRTDPRYWKDPEKFNPDRFLKNQSQPKYSNSCFGVGVRSCPGKVFAEQQIKIILSTVLRRLKIYTNQKYEDLKCI